MYIRGGAENLSQVMFLYIPPQRIKSFCMCLLKVDPLSFSRFVDAQTAATRIYKKCNKTIEFCSMFCTCTDLCITDTLQALPERA